MSNSKKRVKRPLTKEIDRVRHKIERAITWAKKNDIGIVEGLYCDTRRYGDLVCPLGAVYVRDNGLLAANADLNNAENPEKDYLAPALGIKEKDADFFIAGVDGRVSSPKEYSETYGTRVTPRRAAFFRLGQRIAEKHIRA